MTAHGMRGPDRWPRSARARPNAASLAKWVLGSLHACFTGSLCSQRRIPLLVQVRPNRTCLFVWCDTTAESHGQVWPPASIPFH